jgi:ABC-type Mn2+/Zn2+ transport system ATPase subunit
MMQAGEAALLLRARGLELGYGRTSVLSGVDLEVRAGEFWFLIGLNGSGKTTFLKAVLGLLRPRGGRLERHGELARRERLGFVPQRCDLNPSLPSTVREFVSLGLVAAKAAPAERDERLRWALERVGLAGLRHADYWSLSGGQRQRALVARALVRRPGLLVLDEPTEGLDVGTEDALLRTLAELNRDEAMTILFVTHRLAIAARHATHIAVFHEGDVRAGDRSTVLERGDIGAIFGTSVDWSSAASSPSPRVGGDRP